jgi:hypothetical protein
MKKVLSILLVVVFAVAMVFAQEKAVKPQSKAKAKKMECCKEATEKCSEECAKMKAGAKEKQADCSKQCQTKKSAATKEAPPKNEAK